MLHLYLFTNQIHLTDVGIPDIIWKVGTIFGDRGQYSDLLTYMRVVCIDLQEALF